jgi:hypothetical protein
LLLASANSMGRPAAACSICWLWFMVRGSPPCRLGCRSATAADAGRECGEGR